MVTLAHFSDPHLSPLPEPRLRDLLSKRILGYLNYRGNRSHSLGEQTLATLIDDLKAQKPDHIACTGDLVNIALDEEIENTATFLENLSAPEHVSVVPGNHDAYVPGALKKALGKWGAYAQEDGASTPAFPYMRKREDLFIVGVSTSVATGPFMATGTAGKQQLARLDTCLSKLEPHTFNTILVHHPPFEGATRWHKRFTDGEAFLQVVAKHPVHLILHGHTHRRSYQEGASGVGTFPIIGVPSASSDHQGGFQAARYNLFSMEKREKGWRLHQKERGITPDGDVDVLDERTVIIS